VPRCENCGRDVPEDNNFCPQCGMPVSRAGASGAPTQPPAGMPPQPPPGVSTQPPPGVAQEPPPGAPGGVTPPPLPPAGSRAAPKKGMARGAKIALILGVSAIVLIVLAGVIIGVFIANMITAPADVANNYMKALNAGDISTAWSYLTTRTQNQETRKGFDSKAGLLKGSVSKWDTTVVSIQNDEAKIILNVTGTNGSHRPWDMTLIKQDGKWKIDKVSRG
jgi:Domain of unknown function (DUF4878)/zinc-ribbon domain